ncbi:MAG: peptidyl-prolyl cis-trans isomerase [bacterium]
MHRSLDRTAIHVLAMSLILGLISCGGGSDEQVLARIDGREITLQRFLEFHKITTQDARPPEEEYRFLDEKLDELIGYLLIQEGGRKEGYHKADLFRRQLEAHKVRRLNQLTKQREIVEAVRVEPAEIDSFLARSGTERHFQHIIVLDPEAAEEVTRALESGQEWSEVAIHYSKDNAVGMHRGDMGWMSYGERPFSLYPDLERIAYSTPVGEWAGPITEGREHHFIKVLEERERERGTPEEEYAAARDQLRKLRQERLEQEFSNRMWERGGYRLNEDNFRWLVEKVQDSFNRDPAGNPVPELSPRDRDRVIVHSDRHPYTAEDLLDKLEVINPQGRDNAITLDQWRNRVMVDWVIADEVARFAREKGYHEDPAIQDDAERYIDGRLYAAKLKDLRESVEPMSDEEIRAYYEENAEQFDLPERRTIIEVLLPSREQAEEILQRARKGEDLRDLAREHTIREGFAQRGGRFAPIARDEFGSLGEAVFQTPEDELGPIVETPLGYSVFRVDRIHPARELELEDVREGIRTRFLTEGRKAAVDSFVSRVRRRSRIWKNEELLRDFAAQASEMGYEMLEREQTSAEADTARDPRP